MPSFHTTILFKWWETAGVTYLLIDKNVCFLWQPFSQIHLKTRKLLNHTGHADLSCTICQGSMPVHVRKFKDISDEVPFCSLRNPWQQDTAGSCGLPGIQTISIVSQEEKKGRLHKSHCEIILKVFPLPNQNKTWADRDNCSVSTTAAENWFLAVLQFTALITVADGSIISLHVHEFTRCQPSGSAAF